MKKKTLKAQCFRDLPRHHPITSRSVQPSSTPNSSTPTSSHSARPSGRQAPPSHPSIFRTQPRNPRPPSQPPSRPQRQWVRRARNQSRSKPPRSPSPRKWWRTLSGVKPGERALSAQNRRPSCGVRTTRLSPVFWRACRASNRASAWRTFSSWVSFRRFSGLLLFIDRASSRHS